MKIAQKIDKTLTVAKNVVFLQKCARVSQPLWIALTSSDDCLGSAPCPFAKDGRSEADHAPIVCRNEFCLITYCRIKTLSIRVTVFCFLNKKYQFFKPRNVFHGVSNWVKCVALVNPAHLNQQQFIIGKYLLRGPLDEIFQDKILPTQITAR